MSAYRKQAEQMEPGMDYHPGIGLALRTPHGRPPSASYWLTNAARVVLDEPGIEVRMEDLGGDLFRLVLEAHNNKPGQDFRRRVEHVTITRHEIAATARYGQASDWLKQKAEPALRAIRDWRDGLTLEARAARLDAEIARLQRERIQLDEEMGMSKLNTKAVPQ